MAVIKQQFLFGDIVVVEKDLIGVVVKSWGPIMRGGVQTNEFEYDVYVRVSNGIVTYPETGITRYRVRHKYLNDEELEYQNA